MSDLDYPDSMKPLSSYAAKRCPLRVQLDIVQPVEPLPTPPDLEMRFEDGNEFEASITEQLRQVAGTDWVFVPDGEPEDERAASMLAIENRAPVIVNCRLARDMVGYRSGAPDLLVWGDDGYLPVDIKHHRALRGTGSALTSTLAAPFPSTADASGQDLYPRKTNALQLAHYRRMLEVLGISATKCVGGIIGKEGVVAWYNLNEPIWTTPSKSNAPRSTKERTALEAYDFEFEFRRDMAANAHRLLDGDAVELLLPIRITDCASCGWRQYCDQTLQAGYGDTSLLPRIGYKEWRKLRETGIEDRNDVASLDYPTALLQSAGVDTYKWLELAKDALPDTPIQKINGRARKQIAILQEAGISTAADVIASIDPATAAIGEPFLAKAILNATAAISDEPVYRRPDGQAEPIPRADIEVDVDMEKTIDGVYLWGVLVTDRSRSGLVEDGYRAFHSWEPLTEEVEMGIFRQFWDWLTELLAAAAGQGVTVKAYCWYDPAENTQLRRIAERTPDLSGDIEAFIASGQWVDLKKEFDIRFITGESTGLKLVAPLAGFNWGVEDAGGGISMLHHRNATRGDVAAQEWLLTYNEGDVEATKAIREWLAAESFPDLNV